MLTFIATILLIYLVWLLVKPMLYAYARRKYTQHVNDMFRRHFGMDGSGPFSQGPFSQEPDADPRRRQRQQRARRKVFDKSEGEYVEFEDIREETRTTPPPPPADGTYTPREPQVSDADWEDI